MSRIFDALKKSQAGRERADQPTEIMPPQAPIAPTPIHSVMGRSAPVAITGLERAEIAPLGPAAPLDEAAMRELSALRIHIDGLLPNRPPRTLMFLSAQRGEGTSTVALQFAESLTRTSNLRVLLIDANTAHSSPLLATARQVVRTGRPGVDLLAINERLRAAGSSLPRTIRDLIDTAGSGYDWVIVDSPALLASPESAPLASVMDGVIIVVQAGRTKRPVLTRVSDILRRSGANVLGTVLNRRRLEIPDFLYRRI